MVGIADAAGSSHSESFLDVLRLRIPCSFVASVVALSSRVDLMETWPDVDEVLADVGGEEVVCEVEPVVELKDVMR